ncbi:alpha-1,3-mannosyl-glycoprotein 4-beta-N-acetylglucosaminyltransferase B-like [Lycorma delicatula]|uniref:alpha-1,3-mannosyl-glycoprotein 4-beta-N-acetylglucosaminyltransferase B-like n=1 Tax=Lycorma delicatula TaxID=130591 RepID=UPI003F5126E6
MSFQDEFNSGVLEVISPSPAYYPDTSRLRITLGDPPERVRWRSKQNLDFAYLMMYSQPKAVFYDQLDDILAKPHFITTMKIAAYDRIANKQSRFVLDFCQLGFIGKMFRCVELPWLVQLFFMFYSDKPVDRLLENEIHTKVSLLATDDAACRRAKDELWVHYKPSLFQHIGTQPSLKEKLKKSGNAEHPSDRFYNTTVEVLLKIVPLSEASENMTSDGYVIIGKFDSRCIAEGVVSQKLGAFSELRLTVHSVSDNRAILSEIFIWGQEAR